MFAKFSPDGGGGLRKRIQSVCGRPGQRQYAASLTMDGNRKFINGTFDWVYEEEFFCRDGFRWSPDSKHLAYWQIRCRKTRDYLMVDNTDSIYPFAVPVEYPIAGEPAVAF